ncbi:MAG: MobF family relaxase [Acidimicrobiales bacterium]
MLSVAKLARGREEYYLATLASGRAEASGLIEPEGRWVGRAAGTLGLSGTVDGPALRALLAGVDPASGEVLSAHHDRVRVAAYDCTYSTPKSVSLLHALGPEEVRTQVRAGHEEAAEAALGYLERRGARVRRSLGRGEPASSIPAGGFAAAAFLHRTSRAPDPHLHSHVLVANLAPGPDGRWSALDGRGLYLELGTARDLYETQLRSELTLRLGVSWRELQGAWADLAGIDPSVSRAFSRRSAEIEAALEQSGRSGPRARRIASVKTRPGKDLGTPYEELVSDWRERSYRLGVSDARLASVAGRSQAGVPEAGGRSEDDDSRLENRTLPMAGSRSRLDDRPGDRWAERALGEQGVAARDGTCRRGDLVRSRCASLPFGAPVEEIERDVEALVVEGHVVPAPEASRRVGPVLKAASGRPIPGGVAEPLYTTPGVLELHERLEQLVGAHPGAVELLAYRSGERLEALDEIGRVLSDPQTPVVAVAPGRVSAASFEAVTGIETVPIADAPRARHQMAPEFAGKGIVVLAEAQRLGPWELSSIVESSVATGGRAVLFAPSAALETSPGTAAVLAPHLEAFVPRRRPHEATVDGVTLEGVTFGDAGVAGVAGAERYCFAGREVLVVADSTAARRALLEAWRQDRAGGQRTLLVASDDAVVGSLREAVRKAGGSPEDVVEARRLVGVLAGTLPGSGHGRRIAVLGALPAGVREAGTLERVHVAIVPSHTSEAERLGRAAEVARPRYLVSELGTIPSGGSDRAAWRAGATVIEAFRRRWSIEDHEHAVGDRASLRSLGLSAVGDAAETRLKLRQVLRSIERASPAARRHGPDGPGRSR